MFKKILIVIAIIAWGLLAVQVTNYLHQLDRELSYLDV